MLNVFLNNGQEFQEISMEEGASAKVVRDSSGELNGALMLACYDHQGREVARFKWEVVAGFAVTQAMPY